MKNGTSGRSEYRFDARSQNFFESEGYLVIRNALTSEQVTELNQAIDLVYEQQKAEDRLEREGKLNLRNSIIHHDAFLQLLDMPTAAPLAWQILNWNIQMITTHLIVLPPSKEPDDNVKYKIGSHRDGGTSHNEMQEPHPRILLKIAYALSDQTDPAFAATVLVPGSNRLSGHLSIDPETGGARGAISMNVNAGDAFVFEQRAWHGIGRNWSNISRKTIFVGYAYRWVKPMDYIAMPDKFVAKCNPIQKQLVGVASDPLSYYLPVETDVPLRAHAGS